MKEFKIILIIFLSVILLLFLSIVVFTVSGSHRRVYHPTEKELNYRGYYRKGTSYNNGKDEQFGSNMSKLLSGNKVMKKKYGYE